MSLESGHRHQNLFSSPVIKCTLSKCIENRFVWRHSMPGYYYQRMFTWIRACGLWLSMTSRLSMAWSLLIEDEMPRKSIMTDNYEGRENDPFWSIIAYREMEESIRNSAAFSFCCAHKIRVYPRPDASPPGLDYGMHNFTAGWLACLANGRQCNCWQALMVDFTLAARHQSWRRNAHLKGRRIKRVSQLFSWGIQ